MSEMLASLRARIDAQKAKRPGSIPYCPHTPTAKQAAFLALDNLEAFYGGAAIGGKSDALLMCALRYVKRPGYAALILRRTLPDLALPGAIMDRAKSWLIPQGVQWNEVGKFFTFTTEGAPAKLQFGFCETHADVYRYQGSEFHSMGVDEVTQWKEETYRYLLSRIRRTKEDTIPLRMRCAGNPGGIGHKWVKKRFVNPGSPDRPFIAARAVDNPHINAEEYAATLDLLDETTRAQLRDGLWIDDGTGRVYKYEASRNNAAEIPAETMGWQCVLAVDLGASELKPTTAFAIVMWHHEHPVAYCVRSWAEAGMTPSTCAERIREVLALFPEARITMDEGALGKGYANEMRQRYSLPIVPAEKSDKLGAIRLINGALEQGNLCLFAPECAMLVEELESLQWHESGLKSEPGQPNHCTDALLYGWRMAQSWRSVYHVVPPTETEEQAWERRDREAFQNSKRDPWRDW